MGGRRGIWPVKNMAGWWRQALVSPDGVAPSGMVSVSASVNLPLHHKVHKFSSGTGTPGWARKKGRKMVVCVCVCVAAAGKNHPMMQMKSEKPTFRTLTLLCQLHQLYLNLCSTQISISVFISIKHTASATSKLSGTFYGRSM